MLEQFWPVYAALVAHSLLVVVSSRSIRPFVAVLWLTSVYYAALGPLYWITQQDGVFLGVHWDADIPRSALYIACSCLGFATSACVWHAILQQLGARSRDVAFVPRAMTPAVDPWRFSASAWRLCFVVGLIATLLVLANTPAGGLPPDEAERPSYVAYQFSDLLIPTLVFALAARGMDRLTVPLLLLFVGYCTFVGFRYKLVLACFPLAVMYMFPVRGRRHVPLVVTFGLLVATVGLFGVMTLTRQKFGGLDLSTLSSASLDDMLYGYLAESNTVFGMIGILREAVDFHRHIGWTPIHDAFLELVPRTFVPDRVTGEYLQLPMVRLLSPEALSSGTAFPYAGELLLMGGHTALVVGTALLGLVYALLARAISGLPPALAAIENAGHGLLAVYFGYYYFSRGYFPQTFKALLFTILPYVLFAALTRRAFRPAFSASGLATRTPTARRLMHAGGGDDR